eukprot:gene13088-8934_t
MWLFTSESKLISVTNPLKHPHYAATQHGIISQVLQYYNLTPTPTWKPTLRQHSNTRYIKYPTQHPQIHNTQTLRYIYKNPTTFNEYKLVRNKPTPANMNHLQTIITNNYNLSQQSRTNTHNITSNHNKHNIKLTPSNIYKTNKKTKTLLQYH